MCDASWGAGLMLGRAGRREGAMKGMGGGEGGEGGEGGGASGNGVGSV